MSDSVETRSTKASTSARCSSVVISATSGCSGASTTKVMPKLVSGRVVYTVIGLAWRAGDGQVELGPLGAPDPVALHGLDPLRPLQVVEGGEQLVGVGGDAEEPLLEVPLDDHVAAALAGAVGQHLLVGQHGLATRAPVDRGHLPVGQARLEEPLEDDLVPLDVTGSWLRISRRQS